MRKKLILYPCFAFIFIITSCGPAAEERAKMMQSAKRTADSIENVIKISMNAAAEGAGYPNVAPPTPTTAAITTAVPTTTVK